MSAKTRLGNYFEDFRLGQEIVHATPRTVTDGDVALYTAFFGSRFAVTSSARFATDLGLERAPIDSLLAFHIVFGKTVPDISLNAVANLGYANGRFGQLVYPGDTLSTTSTVIGLRQNKDSKTGVVYVRSIGDNQRREMVVDYIRWVMVRKNDLNAPAPETVVPELPDAVGVGELVVPYNLRAERYDTVLSGSPHLWEDYQVGERIDHVDGMTIEEAEHMMATRLYQNTARVHFNQHVEKDSRFGRRSSTVGTSSASRARFPSTGLPMRSAWWRSTAAVTRIRPSPAIRCTPGQRSLTRWRCPAARTSAHYACAPSPPRTDRATTSPIRMPKANTTPRSSWISTTPC